MPSFMKIRQIVQRLKGWHTDIMPIAYAHFPSSRKKIRLRNAVKKNSNLNILTNVYIDILILTSKSHTEM